MTKDETLRLALEALEADEYDMVDDGSGHMVFVKDKAITAIKQVMGQPDPEPDYYGLTAEHLWMSISKTQYDKLKPDYRMACYTSPPKREPLTDEMKSQAKRAYPHDEKRALAFVDGWFSAEAAHGIKGEA